MLEAWRRAGTVGMIGFNHRFHPVVRAAKAALARGSIGEVSAVRSTFGAARRALPEWRARARIGRRCAAGPRGSSCRHGAFPVRHRGERGERARFARCRATAIPRSRRCGCRPGRSTRFAPRWLRWSRTGSRSTARAASSSSIGIARRAWGGGRGSAMRVAGRACWRQVPRSCDPRSRCVTSSSRRTIARSHLPWRLSSGRRAEGPRRRPTSTTGWRASPWCSRQNGLREKGSSWRRERLR